MFDGKAFGLEIVDAVKSHMATALAPLSARLDALEKQVASIPAPKDVPDLALVERVFQSDTKALAGELRSEMKALVPDVERIVAPLIASAIKEYSATVKAPKEIDPKDIVAIVKQDVSSDIADLRKAVEAIPAPIEIDADAIVMAAKEATALEIVGIRDEIKALPAPEPLPDVKAMIDDAISALPKPENGKSVTVEDIAPLLETLVSKAVARIPPPADGKSVTLDDARPVIEDAVARAVAILPEAKDGKPGLGVAGAIIDRSGNLVLTLSDGTTKDLGPVVGKSVDEKAIAQMVETAVARAVSGLPKPQDGKSVTVDDVRPVLAGMVEAAVKAIPAPKDGKDADPKETASLVSEMVAKAVAGLPKPKDGIDGKSVKIEDVVPLINSQVMAAVKDIGETIPELIDVAVKAIPVPRDGKDVDMATIKSLVDEAVKTIPVPQDGKSVDPKEVEAMVRKSVETALAGWERPKDGKSVSMDDVRPVLTEMVSNAVAGLPKVKDGIGVAGALIDRNGNLVFTLSDGKTKELGRVEGKNGIDVDMAAVEKMIAEKIAAIPAPKDGLDGIGFDDMDMVLDDNGAAFRFAKGDRVKEFRIPVPIDCGVYKEGRVYQKGNGVSYAGSFFISQTDDNADRPETSKSWRLAVKRGRDRNDPVKIGE